ncbi:putative fungal-specific transcription factor [Mycena crocata]|nr:putative fungal-specific transcription factor [Mycena crocata]
MRSAHGCAGLMVAVESLTARQQTRSNVWIFGNHMPSILRWTRLSVAVQRALHTRWSFVCKKRKIRCDSGQMPGNRCSHCINMGLDCTHQDIMKTLSSAKGYVAALENRVEKMEKLLNKLLPGIDFTEQFLNENDDEVVPLMHRVESLPRNDMDHISGSFSKFSLNPAENRFFGKSSGVTLVQTALNFHSHVSGVTPQPDFSNLPNKRSTFWDMPKWRIPPPGDDSPQYMFPDPDLLSVLVDLYFKEVNCYWPVLHRPTFERKVMDKLHLRDHRFAATLLLVSSLGARHCDDTRVNLEDETTFHSAGWKWYNQVQVIPESLICKPDLYELQTIALSAMYLMALSPTAESWIHIGFGLRRAQDVGAHRRRTQSEPTTESEQWKRIFWVLICLEWVSGTRTGRPMAIHDRDFDQDLPIECDDQYFDLPGPSNFKQPKDIPSETSYFIRYIKLLEIQAAVTTTIYSPRPARDIHGQPFAPTDAQNIMAFDSALNSWMLGIPDHLRWDPERKNKLHLSQSALLYAEYYSVQILVHRPFIPSPSEEAQPDAHPSLAICTNAARLIARIFDALIKRQVPVHYNMLLPAFTACIVLLINTWSGKRSGLTHNPSKEMDFIGTCLNVTRAAEDRYFSAGRYSDILNRLVHAGEHINVLFGSKPMSSAPLSAQQNSETSSAQDLPWPSAFVRHHVADFAPYPENGSSAPFPENDGTNDHPTAVYNFNQPLDFNRSLDMHMHQFSADMPIDTGIMSMWSSAPSTFHVDDWSYIMANNAPDTQFDQFTPTLNDAYLGSPGPDQGRQGPWYGS